jgi:DNA repair protein RecO (recombination protein O)
MNIVLDHLGDPPVAAALLIRFELALLKELGFGLDLVECASTGSRDGLVYVSPKSG